MAKVVIPLCMGDSSEAWRILQGIPPRQRSAWIRRAIVAYAQQPEPSLAQVLGELQELRRQLARAPAGAPAAERPAELRPEVKGKLKGLGKG
jgi:hypothetical protein